MQCNGVQENLVAFIHGELAPIEMMALHRHLGSCESCLTKELELRKTSRMLDKYPFEPLPENFDIELDRKLEQAIFKKISRKRNFRPILYAAAATILITIGVEFFVSQLLRPEIRPGHLADLATVETVFKPAKQAIIIKTSWKERYMNKWGSNESSLKRTKYAK